ncbi:ABC transporter permease subunit [bacterium BD-1]|nr:ABC transporter permease subunit [Ottowia caeni]
MKWGSPVLVACSAPALAFFFAFWLIPAGVLLVLPAKAGISTYFSTFTDTLYLNILWQTLVLSMGVTVVTLAIGALTGVALARVRFPGRGLLLSLLTLPLSFAGVIVGFYVILIGGRQGVLAQVTDSLFGERISFAYGFIGLFLGYLYFSLPRAISAYTAAAEAMDAQIEEAARSLGASGWAVMRDVWWPQLLPTTMACGSIVFATAVGAFGTAFTLSSNFEVLPITIYNEFTNYANFALAASLSITLGLITWLVLWSARKLAGPNAAGI